MTRSVYQCHCEESRNLSGQRSNLNLCCRWQLYGRHCWIGVKAPYIIMSENVEIQSRQREIAAQRAIGVG